MTELPQWAAVVIFGASIALFVGGGVAYLLAGRVKRGLALLSIGLLLVVYLWIQLPQLRSLNVAH